MAYVKLTGVYET